MWDHIINIHSSELLHTKTKESRINKYKNILKIDNYIFYLTTFLQDILKS